MTSARSSRPIDTDAIQAEISQLEIQKRDLDDQLDRLETLDDRLPDLEQQRTQLEDQIEAKRAELEEKEPPSKTPIALSTQPVQQTLTGKAQNLRCSECASIVDGRQLISLIEV
jgi:chromosome segregation ATPase